MAQWVDGKPQFVQAFDAAESAGGSGLEGAAGSEAHPQGLSTLDARTLAQHASHQACRVGGLWVWEYAERDVAGQ